MPTLFFACLCLFCQELEMLKEVTEASVSMNDEVNQLQTQSLYRSRGQKHTFRKEYSFWYFSDSPHVDVCCVSIQGLQLLENAHAVCKGCVLCGQEKSEPSTFKWVTRDNILCTEDNILMASFSCEHLVSDQLLVTQWILLLLTNGHVIKHNC